MKKCIGKLLILFAIGLVICLIAGAIIKKAKAGEAAEKIRSLPDIVMIDINGNEFCTSEMTSGPLLITFFHPECDYCRYEISSLINDGFLNSKLKMLLVSYADSQAIQTFMQELEIANESNLIFIHDPDFKLTDMFRAEIIPSNYLYNDSLRLVKVFKGATKPETLLKYLVGND